MARRYEVLRGRIRIHRCKNGHSPIMCRNTRGHPASCFYGDGKTCSKRGLVVSHHHGQLQGVNLLWGHGKAQEATAILGHEVDGLGGNLFRGHREVAFVFTVFVVNEYDHATLFDFFYCFRYFH